MPQDSIMDWVNNEEGLYNEVQELYERWMEEGDAWSERQALKEARMLSEHFAQAIGGKYGESDFREAADQMIEEFEEHREYVIREAATRQRAPRPRDPMTPEAIEFAEKCEGIAQRIGVDVLRTLVPASPEAVRKALESGDEHLNTIPLRKWDRAANALPRGQGLSLSDRVCALKHVAKFHYA